MLGVSWGQFRVWVLVITIYIVLFPHLGRGVAHTRLQLGQRCEREDAALSRETALPERRLL
jgi:hypothetical protein